MSLQDWERDVRNRQRNIVFPDTVLNEGRFYRNIASGKAVFSLGQRISLLVIVGFVMIVTCIGLAEVIGAIRAQRDSGLPLFELWAFIYLLAILFFWMFLAIKGLLPPGPTRKRRSGYRRSNRF